MTITNTYKQVLDQLTTNWYNDAYIQNATCENDSEG